jgi:hypothetical protein
MDRIERISSGTALDPLRQPADGLAGLRRSRLAMDGRCDPAAMATGLQILSK